MTFFGPSGDQAEEDEEGKEKSERLHDDGAVNAAEPRMSVLWLEPAWNANKQVRSVEDEEKAVGHFPLHL